MTVGISIHALREEGDLYNTEAVKLLLKKFLSTPSARRATKTDINPMWRIKFLSTPSARRATFAVTAKRRKGNKFLSTPSARRATFWWADVPRICIEFLSTPSARRATDFHAVMVPGKAISIHALREEGDHKEYSLFHLCRHFYPRPPRGGRPHWLSSLSARRLRISIHALREEGDPIGCPAFRPDA